MRFIPILGLVMITLASCSSKEPPCTGAKYIEEDKIYHTCLCLEGKLEIWHRKMCYRFTNKSMEIPNMSAAESKETHRAAEQKEQKCSKRISKACAQKFTGGRSLINVANEIGTIFRAIF